MQRTRSNTPLAALITLNNATFTEAARALAKRLQEDLPDAPVETHLKQAFEHCLARPPAEDELLALTDLHKTSQAWYAEHPEDAKALQSDAPELAALTATVRVVLNLDEFLTRN